MFIDLTAPDHRSRGGIALAALAGKGHRSDSLGTREPQSLEGDLLGAWGQARNGEPAVGVWACGDRLAARR